MARYSKNNSNFIIRKKHQSIEGGTILERDWSTLGERHVIESGKRKVYGDSGFLFTDSTRPGLKKRNRSGEWDAPLTLNDLTDTVNDSVNIIQLPKSNDLRDYAYWGSAKELVRSSIENIVKWFPGRIWAEDIPIYIPNNNGSGMNAIADIIGDGHGNYIIKTVKENEVIIDNGDCITFGDGPKPCITFSCDTDIIEDNSNIGLWLLHNPFQINLINTSLQFTKYDNQLRALAVNWKQYSLNGYDITGYKVWIKPINECDKDYTILYDITITYKKNKEKLTGHIYGLKLGKNILWCTTLRKLDIRPKLRIIEDYFKNLQGFDKVLLTRETYPLYTANIITPVEISYNYYVYVAKSYQWPSTDYCIDVDGIGFELYIDKLYKLSELIDNLWTNNLWENMTHESIKNFDWTYEREDEENIDNVEGSNRMEQVLQIMGAHFDDMKRWVDNIKHKNTITYDGNNNLPNAELSDKCNSLGWETYSTKLNPNDNLYLDSGNIFTTNIKWFNNLNPNQVNQNYIDNEFMRRLALSAKEIFKTKGTKQGIEMVFGMFGIGESDFEIIERYYTIEQLYKKDDIYRFYRKNDIVNSEITEEEIYNTYELQSSNSLQEWLQGKIEENGGNPILGDELPKHIKFGTDPDFIHYDLDDTMTVGQFLAYANECKSIVHNYDDVFSGVPLKIVTIDGIEYIAPYFSQDKIYDGDVQFETNGGWGKYIENFSELDNVINQNYNYLETLPYIEIVQNCSQLLNVNPYTIGKKTIFYVMNTSDYVEFNENIPDGLSHYFKLINPINPNLKSSWKTIPMVNISKEDYNNLCNSDGAFQGVTYTDYLEAMYHDGLIQDNLANNPHCGYAKYDLGTEYLEYCKQPFKYSIDKYLIMEYDILEALKLLTFKINTHYGEKMINLVNNQENNINYYLPSKMVILKNNIDNEYYKEYLNNVILKYVLQVIPSTTILVLENCLKSIEKCNITINYVDSEGNVIYNSEIITKLINSSLTILPKSISCYQAIYWKYNNSTDTYDNFFIDNITEDIEIDIIYESQKHTVNVVVEPQDLTNDVSVNITKDECGNTGIITIENKNKCYNYVGLYDKNNKLISSKSTYEYNVTTDSVKDIIYTAKFELSKKTITINKPEDVDNDIIVYYKIDSGDIKNIKLEKDKNKINVNCNSSIELWVENNIDGYQFNKWTGDFSTNDNPLLIDNINNNYNITPNYQINQYIITVYPPVGINNCQIEYQIGTDKSNSKTITLNGTNGYVITLNYHDDIIFRHKDINDYTFNGWIYVPNSGDINIQNNELQIKDIERDYIEIRPTYNRSQVTITVEKPDNVNDATITYNGQTLSLSINKSFSATIGSTIVITANQTGNYECYDWITDGNNTYVEQDNELSFTVNNDCTVKPVYRTLQYTVTLKYRPLPEQYNTDNSVLKNLVGNYSKLYQCKTDNYNTNDNIYYGGEQTRVYNPGDSVEFGAYIVNPNNNNQINGLYSEDLTCDSWWEENNNNYTLLTNDITYNIPNLQSNKIICGYVVKNNIVCNILVSINNNLISSRMDPDFLITVPRYNAADGEEQAILAPNGSYWMVDNNNCYISSISLVGLKFRIKYLPTNPGNLPQISCQSRINNHSQWETLNFETTDWVNGECMLTIPSNTNWSTLDIYTTYNRTININLNI